MPKLAIIKDDGTFANPPSLAGCTGAPAGEVPDGSVGMEKLGADVTPANLGCATAGHNHDASYAAIGHTHEGGGNDSRLLVAQGTAGANTTSNTTGVSTGIAFTLGTGEYVITCIMGVTTAATTTAPCFTFNGSGGLVVASFDMQADVSTTAVASQPSNTNALGTFTAPTTGQGATRRPVVVTARVRVTTGGTATLQMRSEVSGSTVTMVEGSGFAIKVA